MKELTVLLSKGLLEIEDLKEQLRWKTEESEALESEIEKYEGASMIRALNHKILV